MSQPSRRPWPPEHEAIARTMLAQGHSNADVAAALGRTHASIRHWRSRQAHRVEAEFRDLVRSIVTTHAADPGLSNGAIAEITGASVQLVVRVLAMPMPQFRERYLAEPRPPQIGPQP
jgi:hypothetical protein